MQEEMAKVLEESKKMYEEQNKDEEKEEEKKPEEPKEEEKGPEKPKYIKLEVFIGEDEVFDDVAKARLVYEILKKRLGS